MPQTRNIPVSPIDASVVTFTMKVEGTVIPRTYGIKTFSISRQVNKIPRLYIAIVDGNPATGDFDVSNEDLFIPGKKIEVHGGYNSQETLLFKGIIIKHSIKITTQGPGLLIEAADEIIKMTASPKRRVYENIKDSDVISQLASQYALDTDIESTELVHGQLMQYYATDWDYIQTRAEANGKLCFCENGKLLVKAPEVDGKRVLDITYGATIKELNAEIDTRYQFSKVQGIGWNSTDQELIDVEAVNRSIEGVGNLSPADLAQVMQQEPYNIVYGGNSMRDEIRTRADMLLLKSQLAKVRGTVKITGYPQIMPGQVVKLDGLGNRFNGNAYVSGVRHEFGDGLWDTTLQFGLSHKWFAAENDIQPLPAAGATPGVKGLQIGIVTDLDDDPEGNDRVKVKFPVVDNNSDGIWCKMAMPDAGKERGFFFRPEIGDEVVVGFLHEDPDYGVILGCLHSSAKPAPLRASNNNDEKGIITRSNMKMIWNDDKKSLQIESPAGNKITMSEEDKELRLQDQHGNKIVMNADGISIESTKDIKIKSREKMEANAGTEFNIKGMSLMANGTTSTDVTSSGNTTIKGALVIIN